MAHNINEKRMFYYGEKPWHGIGTELDRPATAKEAIVAAGLNYEIEKRPVYTTDESGNKLDVPDFYATVRQDTNEPLGVVGEKYAVIQNKEAFNFFDAIVGEGQAIYHTAGALGKGEWIWLLAKLPKNTVVFKDDVVEKYLCLTNTHNGRSSLRVYFTPVRVVCQNTLTCSLRDAKSGISIRHTGDFKTRVKESQRVLGLALNFYSGFEETAKALVRKPLDSRLVNNYFDSVLRITEEDEKKVSTRLKKTKKSLLNLFENGKGNDMPGVRGSLWAAYNAVTEHIDHVTNVKNSKKDPTNRLKSIWFENGANVKSRAFDEAVLVLKN